jgi:hypothetical protein
LTEQEKRFQTIKDLAALRAQEDRLVTENVLRKDWDAASAAAKKADQVTAAIHRVVRDADAQAGGLQAVG